MAQGRNLTLAPARVVREQRLDSRRGSWFRNEGNGVLGGGENEEKIEVTSLLCKLVGIISSIISRLVFALVTSAME